MGNSKSKNAKEKGKKASTPKSQQSVIGTPNIPPQTPPSYESVNSASDPVNGATESSSIDSTLPSTQNTSHISETSLSNSFSTPPKMPMFSLQLPTEETTADQIASCYTPKTLSILSPTTFKNVLNSKEMVALSKIQKSARRKISMNKAHAQDRWKIFADLDSADEAEMLQLACYFQTFFQFVPDLDGGASRGAVPPTPSLYNDEEEFSFGSIEIAEPVHAEPSEKNKKNMRNFEIENKNFDQPLVEDVIDLYRHGGRLHVKTLIRIMRQAYKVLKDVPNVVPISIDSTSKLTVVGDLHGQLSDLLFILDESGLPSPTNKYIFNGDFVDRGDHGLEVITILFSMICAFGPEVVALNRGNHEDDAVCRVYGFESEVKSKYADVVIFDMFAEIFRYLPVCSLVNDKVLVIHGGLFHQVDVSVQQDLALIERMNYHPKLDYYYSADVEGVAVPPSGSHNSSNEENLAAVMSAMANPDPTEDPVKQAARRKAYLNMLFREALWSDPDPEEGITPSKRGIGVQFGPDVARRFMELNGLSMIVRSHECALTGFDLPYSSVHVEKHHHAGNLPPSDPLLCTIFSASNYCQQDNDGAYLVFRTHPCHNCASVPGSDLHFTFHRHKTSESSLENISESNHFSLTQLIHRRLGALELAFETIDVGNTGLVSKVEWAETMSRVTGIKIRWLSLVSALAPENCQRGESIDYEAYLQSFSLEEKYGSAFPVPNPLPPPPPPPPSTPTPPSFFNSNSKPTFSLMIPEPDPEDSYTLSTAHLPHPLPSQQRKGSPRSSSPLSQSAQNQCFSPRLSFKSLDLMYAQRRKLEIIFYFFDKNADGVISREEFRQGCEALNRLMDPRKGDRQLRNIDRTLELMDLEKTGNININEFFEIFRILESKDPKFVAGLSVSGGLTGRGGRSEASTPRAVRMALTEEHTH